MPQNREGRTRTAEKLDGPQVERGRTSTSEQVTNLRQLPGRAKNPLEIPPNEAGSANPPALLHGRNSDRSRSLSPTKNYGVVANRKISEMNPQQFPSASDIGACNVDIVPQDFSSQESTASVSGRTPSAHIPPYMADGYRDASTPTHSNSQSTSLARAPSSQTYDQSYRLHPATPPRQSFSLMKKFSGMFYSPSESSSTTYDLEQRLYRTEREIEQLREVLRERNTTIKQMSNAHQNEVNSLKKNLQKALDNKNRELDAARKNVERYKEQINREQEESMRRMQAEVREIESDRNLLKEKYDAFIRRQQEESFRQMESGRWLPSEESKVVGDLERIKREMKTWAKGTSIKDMLILQTLAETDNAELMKGLSTVVLLENNLLPQGLSTPKSPSLLLNALLAHDVYANIFRNPFFFLNDGFGHDLPRTGAENILNYIYGLMQNSNPQDAHIWRSQMLRLLLPPLRTDSNEGEMSLRSWTEGRIARVSGRQASDFLTSPARYLISNDAKPGYDNKLRTIYQEAATLSYMLWTRRTTMRCVTLREMGHPTFDIDDPCLVPHTLVRHDEHDDQLRDRPITVIVHPLVEVFGTDEAKDYDKGRVWAPAEVWLDSQ